MILPWERAPLATNLVLGTLSGNLRRGPWACSGDPQTGGFRVKGAWVRVTVGMEVDSWGGGGF